jgi:hypothetical protein
VAFLARRRSLLAGAVGALLLAGCGGCGSTTTTARRLRSPDGRVELVLTVRSGGGAAGFAEERVALVPRGRRVEPADALATFDPDQLLGARWLSPNVAEIGLDGAPSGDSPPELARVGGRLVALRVRDFARCRLAGTRVLASAGMTLLARGSDCGDGVGRLVVSASDGDGLSARLVDAAVRWPARLDVSAHGIRIRIRARRIYGGPRRQRVGGPHGEPFVVAWPAG